MIAWAACRLFAFRLIVGLGMAGEYSASATYVLESWPRRIRNKASAFLLTGYTVGSLVVALIYPFMISHFGWRSLFFLGILPVFLTIYMPTNLRESAEFEEARQKGETATGVSFFSLFSEKWFPVFLTITAFIFSAFMDSWPLQSLMPTYLKLVGYDPKGVAEILFIVNFGTLLGIIAIGFLGDRVGTRRVYIYALIISLFLIVPVFAIGKSSILLLGSLVFVLLFWSQGLAGMHPKYMAEHFAPNVRGVGLGVAYNIGSLGGAIAPILGTALAIQVGLGWALAIPMFSWTLVVIVIVGFNIPGRILRRTVGVDSFNAEPIEPEKHIEPSDVTETKPVNLV